MKIYSRYHKDYYNAELIFAEHVKKHQTTILNLISWDGSIEVDVKILHEFGVKYGFVPKFATDKKFGKMTEKEEFEIIGYLSQFKLR